MNDKPQILCVCCGKILDAKYQSPIAPGGKSLFHLTCEDVACEMFGYTLTDRGYPPSDLEIYLESGRQRLEQLKAGV